MFTRDDGSGNCAPGHSCWVLGVTSDDPVAGGVGTAIEISRNIYGITSIYLDGPVTAPSVASPGSVTGGTVASATSVAGQYHWATGQSGSSIPVQANAGLFNFFQSSGYTQTISYGSSSTVKGNLTFARCTTTLTCDSMTFDANGLTVPLPLNSGPTAPTGACTVVGWSFTDDGHATFCNGTTWSTKI